MGKKRGNGEGTIYQKPDGRWCACVSLGYVGGKRKRKYIMGATRKEVAAKLARFQHEKQQGTAIIDERQTVAQYLAFWLENTVKRNRKPSTYASYEERIRTHIVPGLGRIPIARLSPQDIEAFLNLKRDEGKLGPHAVAYLHRILRSALTQAVKKGLVSRNVATLVDMPTLPRVERQVLDPEQARAFLAALKGDRLEALYAVGFAIGLRRGEALGLQWRDIDLDAGVLTVRHQLQRISGTLQLVEYAKTKAGHRTIKLPVVALQALHEHRRRQLADRIALGSEWHGGDFVFTSTHGTPIDGRNALRQFQNALNRANLPHQRFHDMRHACASLLIAQGVPDMIVMQMLGHSSITITKNIYGHVYPTGQQQAADTIDGLLQARE